MHFKKLIFVFTMAFATMNVVTSTAKYNENVLLRNNILRRERKQLEANGIKGEAAEHVMHWAGSKLLLDNVINHGGAKKPFKPTNGQRSKDVHVEKKDEKDSVEATQNDSVDNTTEFKEAEKQYETCKQQLREQYTEFTEVKACPRRINTGSLSASCLCSTTCYEYYCKDKTQCDIEKMNKCEALCNSCASEENKLGVSYSNKCVAKRVDWKKTINDLSKVGKTLLDYSKFNVTKDEDGNTQVLYNDFCSQLGGKRDSEMCKMLKQNAGRSMTTEFAVYEHGKNQPQTYVLTFNFNQAVQWFDAPTVKPKINSKDHGCFSSDAQKAVHVSQCKAFKNEGLQAAFEYKRDEVFSCTRVGGKGLLEAWESRFLDICKFNYHLHRNRHQYNACLSGAAVAKELQKKAEEQKRKTEEIGKKNAEESHKQLNKMQKQQQQQHTRNQEIVNGYQAHANNLNKKYEEQGKQNHVIQNQKFGRRRLLSTSRNKAGRC
jgi:hypothetical protein